MFSNTGDRKPSIFCLAPLNGWDNYQLVKNCGALPYIFHKEYGFRSVMVGVCRYASPEEYTLLKYLPGVEMDFYTDSSVEAKVKYIEQHAWEIDVLVLHGFWPEYTSIVAKYKECNPQGKVYMETDINSHSFDREQWSYPPFLQMLANCDVIGASCRSMQKAVSQKWPCRVEYLPNGFFSFTDIDLSTNYNVKENIILTVGRIGSSQKNNEELIKAFAKIYKKIPDWKLQLTGPTTEDFNKFFNQFCLKNNPGLFHKINLTGSITDKNELMAQYKRAKIFALTSTFEGGTPNVIGEALFNGCYIISSEIDGASDAVNNGLCGKTYPTGNIDALANCLLTACQDEALLQNGFDQAISYAHKKMDFKKVIARLYYLLFQEDHN